jgi:hypothetical protein
MLNYVGIKATEKFLGIMPLTCFREKVCNFFMLRVVAQFVSKEVWEIIE